LISSFGNANLGVADPFQTELKFFQTELSAGRRMRITAACVDMWEAFRLSIEQHAPNCRIVYDNFHVSCNTPMAR
jgi:hypothetical protein